MTTEQLLTLLLERQIYKTQFATVNIPAAANPQGLPLGQGKCIAVILYLNKLVLNTQTNTDTAADVAQVYYGDSQGQFRELLRGQSSDVIFCTDLEQVYVRGNGVANQIQVTIYVDENENAN